MFVLDKMPFYTSANTAWYRLVPNVAVISMAGPQSPLLFGPQMQAQNCPFQCKSSLVVVTRLAGVKVGCQEDDCKLVLMGKPERGHFRMAVQHGILKRSGIFGEAASIWGGCKSGMAGDEAGVVLRTVDNFPFLFVFHPFLLRTAPSHSITSPTYSR